MSFVDLKEEFDVNLINGDEFLKEIKELFCNLLLENYFIKIFSKFETLIHNLSSADKIADNNNEFMLNIQKFYYFYYVFYRMDDVFISFLNSNIDYLINENIQNIISQKSSYYLNQFIGCFLNRVGKEIKIFLMDPQSM